MRKKILFFVLLSLFPLVSNAYLNLDSQERQDCLDILEKSFSGEKFASFQGGEISKTTNDGLIGVDFLNIDLFSKTSYTAGEKTQLLKNDLFRIYDLYGQKSDETFSQKELNFFDINTSSGKVFLGCSFVNNVSLKKKFSLLKKGDVNAVYTSSPKAFEVNENHVNGKKWKIVSVSRDFKDRLGIQSVFQINTTYVVPANQNLKGYYDLYSFIDEFKKFTDWFILRVGNFPMSSINLKEIYNQNGVNIKRYFLGNQPDADPYGIKYVFVNGNSFMNDYAEFKRHKTFEFLLNDNSELVKNIYIIENKWDETTKTYVQPTLDFVWWVQYFLGDIDLDDKTRENLIELQPYYTRERNIIDNSFYNVNTQGVDKNTFKLYLYNNIFHQKNSKTPEQTLQQFKTILIDTKFSELIELNNNFKNESKNFDSMSSSQKKEFVLKYKDLFSNDKVFTNNNEVKTILSNINTTSDSSNSMFVYVIIGVLIVLGTVIFFKRKKV